jgi:hypothetical protein
MSSLLTELIAPKVRLPPRPELANGPACPKCRWIGKDPEVGWYKYLWVDPDSAQRYNFIDENGKPIGECLLVGCERCSYRWREDVATPEPQKAVD